MVETCRLHSFILSRGVNPELESLRRASPQCGNWVNVSVLRLNRGLLNPISPLRGARVPRGKPSTRLQALVGENQNLRKTSMLLLRYRNQRITIVSTPLSPLWIRSWPKLRINSVEITLSYSPTSHSFDSL